VTADDLLELHRRVVRTSIDIVSRVTVADLERATPCSEWNLGDLLAHMTVQHRGFAAAAGEGADLAVWQVRPLGDQAVAAYVAAAEGVIAAFGADGVLEREFALPEITTRMTFPAARAIGFHFIDYVVHGWDVARSIDVPYTLHPDVTETALRIAQEVPDGPERLRPGAAFRPGLVAPAGAGPLEVILAALGRSPAWPS
jgi:uncharacterized protein (TIGR03086 family)